MGYEQFHIVCDECDGAGARDHVTCDACEGNGYTEYGSFEVFYAEGEETPLDGNDQPMPEGWYWWTCFPGCLPDCYPSGPFATEDEAIKDAREES